MASLHQYLTRLPSELDIETWDKIIKKSLYLFRKHPPDTLDVLNDEWNKKWYETTNLSYLIRISSLFSESLDNPSMETILRQRYTRESPSKTIPEENSSDRNEPQGALPRIVLWGVTLTISGLAIYIWNHTQRTDPAAIISLGDFLAQLYGK